MDVNLSSIPNNDVKCLLYKYSIVTYLYKSTEWTMLKKCNMWMSALYLYFLWLFNTLIPPSYNHLSIPSRFFSPQSAHVASNALLTLAGWKWKHTFHFELTYFPVSYCQLIVCFFCHKCETGNLNLTFSARRLLNSFDVLYC